MAGTLAPRPSLVALDTNVLLDLADENEQTRDALDLIRSRGSFQLVVTPTVVQELAFGYDNWKEPKRLLAEVALTSLLRWGISPINLVAVGHGICECVADEIRRRGYLPEEERNDSLILAEAALAECVLLVSWDEHLLSAPSESVAMLLAEKDLSRVIVVAPSKINSLFQVRFRRK